MTSGAPPWPGLPTASRPRRGVAAAFGQVPNTTTGLAGSEFADPDQAATGPGLSARLTALARLIQIGVARGGSDGFSRELLSEAEELLARAGERLRLSASHTVVALGGGTGSGKSSLFNQLVGADFSTVGVTRPVTKDAHACVWGVAGSGPLLEWLGIPRRNRYARSSALDRGEQALAGLVLLDLPDHDSVVSGASGQVDRLIGLADLMVWVLDPQKYADAAVHRRFLVPLAGHSDVVAVVLNQSDLLSEQQAEDCVSDLRRLLDSEGLHDVTILATSAATGAGLGDLRKILVETVSQRRAATTRISADLDAMIARFMPYVSPAVASAAAPVSAGDLNGSGTLDAAGNPDGSGGLDDAGGLDGDVGGLGGGVDGLGGAGGVDGLDGGVEGLGGAGGLDRGVGGLDGGVDGLGGAGGVDEFAEVGEPNGAAGNGAPAADGSDAQPVSAQPDARPDNAQPANAWPDNAQPDSAQPPAGTGEPPWNTADVPGTGTGGRASADAATAAAQAAGNWSAGNGSADSGSAGNGSAENGSAGNGSARNGLAGYGSAGAGPGEAGLAGPPSSASPNIADSGPGAIIAPAVVPTGTTAQLVEAFDKAAGVTAVSDSLRSARELRAVDYVGWPIAWLVDRVTGRSPVRKMQLGKLWDEVRTVTSGPSGAQQAEVDNALTRLADEIGPTLPKPWSRTIRTAVRSRAQEIPPALSASMAQVLPSEDKIVPWWRFIGALQGLLLGAVIVGLAWIGAIIAFGVFDAAKNVPRLFGDVMLIPWVCLMAAAFLFLGWLTASGCMNLVRTAALREHERIQTQMRSRTAVVARELVIVPAEQELSEYQRFEEEFLAAAGRL